MKFSSCLAIAIPAILSITFSTSFADVPVTIPLGASNQNNPFSLSPSTLEIQSNDTVTWKNDDNAAHTVTTGKPGLGFDGRIDSGIIAPGGTFSHTFDKTGVYQYYCIFHPWMTGYVTVGTSVPVIPIGILVSTDQAVYHKGDVIKVSGQVSQFIENKQVTVWITDSKGTGISVSHTETRTGRDFQVDVPISGNLWTSGNNYTVYAQYGPASSVATALIQYEPKPAEDKTAPDNSTEVHATATYMQSYKRLNPDSNSYVTAQTEHRIYNPDSHVTVYGSVWDGTFAEIGGKAYLDTVPISGIGGTTVSDLVTVQLEDKDGKVVSTKEAQADNNGNYAVSIYIPQNASGTYRVESQLKTKAGLLGTIDVSIAAKLHSSADFLVSRSQAFAVPTSSGTMNVDISSNSTVSNFAFDSQNKKISFDVQGETGTRGVSDVTVPKSLLGGPLQVVIDGQVLPYDSAMVVVTSDTESETGLEINYHHSMHTIEVTGTSAAEQAMDTQAVPEFDSLASAILAMATASVLVILYRLGHTRPTCA